MDKFLLTNMLTGGAATTDNQKDADDTKLTEIDINQSEAVKSMQVLESFESKEGEDIDELVLVLEKTETETTSSTTETATTATDKVADDDVTDAGTSLSGDGKEAKQG